MNITFPEGAEDYYKVDVAKELIERYVHNPECVIWRCVLCGYPIFLRADAPDLEIVAATCCGGCGQACMRPISEYGDDLT